MNLISIQDSRIENNVIDSPVRAILLRHSTRVEQKGNLLTDPANHAQSDATSGSRVLGLDATK
jgi:hypothetical protein